MIGRVLPGWSLGPARRTTFRLVARSCRVGRPVLLGERPRILANWSASPGQAFARSCHLAGQSCEVAGQSCQEGGRCGPSMIAIRRRHHAGTRHRPSPSGGLTTPIPPTRQVPTAGEPRIDKVALKHDGSQRKTPHPYPDRAAKPTRRGHGGPAGRRKVRRTYRCRAPSAPLDGKRSRRNRQATVARCAISRAASMYAIAPLEPGSYVMTDCP